MHFDKTLGITIAIGYAAGLMLYNLCCAIFTMVVGRFHNNNPK